MWKLSGIPNCDTVKKARTFLDKNNISYTFVDFKKSPPTLDDIIRWKDFMKALPVNTKGTTYKKHKDIYESLSEKEQIKFICENPSMIKRPVLEKNHKVLFIGFDEKSYKELL